MPGLVARKSFWETSHNLVLERVHGVRAAIGTRVHPNWPLGLSGSG
jgi:hypothetical protein